MSDPRLCPQRCAEAKPAAVIKSRVQAEYSSMLNGAGPSLLPWPGRSGASRE